MIDWYSHPGRIRASFRSCLAQIFWVLLEKSLGLFNLEVMELHCLGKKILSQVNSVKKTVRSLNPLVIVSSP